MSVTIRSGPGPIISGQPASLDFTVNISLAEQQYPAESVTKRLNFTRVTNYFDAYTALENVFTVVSPVPVSVTVSEGFTLTGGVVRKVSGAVSLGQLQVKSAYGTREYQLNPSTGTWRFGAFLRSDTEILNPSSLYAEARFQLESRLSGRTPGLASQSQFLSGETISIPSLVVQENPDFAFRDIDWSMVSIARTGAGGSGLPCVLLSPRHATIALHVGGYVGDSFRFRRPDGSSQVVQIVARRELKLQEGPGPEVDIAVVAFDADVTGCAHAKIMPVGYEELLADTNYRGEGGGAVLWTLARAYNTGIGVAFPQNNVQINNECPKFIVQVVDRIATQVTSQTEFRGEPQLSYGSLAGFMRGLYPGDSGSPIFILAREAGRSTPTPILLATVFTSGSGGDLAFNATWVQDAMNAISDELSIPRYPLLRADLSNYPRAARV